MFCAAAGVPSAVSKTAETRTSHSGVKEAGAAGIGIVPPTGELQSTQCQDRSKSLLMHAKIRCRILLLGMPLLREAGRARFPGKLRDVIYRSSTPLKQTSSRCKRHPSEGSC